MFGTIVPLRGRSRPNTVSSDNRGDQHDSRRISRGRTPPDRLDRRLSRPTSANFRSWRALRRARSKRKLPLQPPLEPEPFDAILADLDNIVMPGFSHWQHPSFFGYFPCNGSLSSVLGDLASTGLGVLGLSWQSSPALTEVEEVVTDWMRRWCGLSDAWSGVIQDTASTCTSDRAASARESGSTDYSLARGGLQGKPQPLIVYTSAHSHSSVEKAALLAGFGRENVRLIEFDSSYAMNPSALEHAILQRPRSPGLKPCADCRDNRHYRCYGDRPD